MRNNLNSKIEKTFVIGLCGGIGSGKSKVSTLLSEKGIFTIEADKIYKEICVDGSECDSRLKAAFPSCVANGVIQRSLLKNLVFNSEKNLKLLNSITHSYIFTAINSAIKGKKVALVEAPLLFESGFDKLCDITVCVTAPHNERASRVSSRDNMPLSLFESIILNQLSDEELVKRCDYEIKNDGDLKALEKNVLDFFEIIKTHAFPL